MRHPASAGCLIGIREDALAARAWGPARVLCVSMRTWWCGRRHGSGLNAGHDPSPSPSPSSISHPSDALDAEVLDTESAFTVAVRSGAAEATARLDLRTLETVLLARVAMTPAYLIAMRYALRRSLERQRSERTRGAVRAGLSYDLSDPSTWTPMQSVAAMNHAWWYPPFPPPEGSSSEWRNYWAEVRLAQRHLRFTFNARTRQSARLRAAPPPASGRGDRRER
jgi:hypothetical protein